MKISPSLLAADFSCLSDAIAPIEAAGADMLHLDVMDGHFVPNLSFGAGVIKAIRPCSDLFFDVHLMISDPVRYLDDFIAAGANGITFHAEAVDDPALLLKKIHQKGLKAALAVSPKTPIDKVFPYLSLCDMILVMTVEPGFGGQKLIPAALEKAVLLRAEIKNRGLGVDIQADGGIGLDNLPQVLHAGVNVVVAGSAIFGAPDPRIVIDAMRAIDQEKTAD